MQRVVSRLSRRVSAKAFAAGNTLELGAGGARRQVRGLGLAEKDTDPAEAASRKIDLGA